MGPTSPPPRPPQVTVDDTPAGDVTLPGGVREAVRAEVTRVLHPPFETLITVAVNAALMSSAWFFLPPALFNQLFSLHGSLAFAFVLSSWMYSDVPATNVLASDGIRVMGAIDQPAVLRRLLLAKAIVLWSIVAPLCLVISFIMGAENTDRIAAVYSAIAIGIVPFGVLAVSAWLGILFPYHPVPLRYRWSQRRQWKTMLLRWGTLVLLPYAVVPGLTIAFLSPSLLIWGLTSPNGLTMKLPDNDLGLGIALACIISLAAVVIGHRVSLHLIARRRDHLVAYLSDPLRG
jgi:hypothetical protein